MKFKGPLATLAMLCLHGLGSAQAKQVHDSKIPNRIFEEAWVIPGGWIDRVPPTGPLNAPGHLDALAPGQHIGLAILAEGDDRDRLLEGRSLQVTITSSAGSVTLAPKASPIRRIKAEGADMVLSALKAGGILGANEKELGQVTSMVSLVAFELPWEAPAISKEETLTLALVVQGGSDPRPRLKPISIKVRPWSAWWADPQPQTPDLNAFMKGFHERPEPGRLLPMLKAALRQKAIEVHGVYGFFVAAFRTQPAARAAELANLESLDPADRWAFLMTLRLGGDDVTVASASLQADAKEAIRTSIPLADPPELLAFEDPVDPQKTLGLGVPMDQCWGGWMATGDPKYLRGLVAQLAYAPFLPDLNHLLETKAGAKGLNAKVAKGLAYRTAGWSLASFDREDPQVADWIAFWEKDPSQPDMVRTQLGTLLTNPAFRQDK